MESTSLTARAHAMPALKRHKGSGQAHVRVKGKMHYFGKWGDDPNTPCLEAVRRYKEFLSVYLVSPEPNKSFSAVAPTVGVLCKRFMQHARVYYMPRTGIRSHCEADNFEDSIRHLLELYESLPVRSFSALHLKNVQRTMLRYRKTEALSGVTKNSYPFISSRPSRTRVSAPWHRQSVCSVNASCNMPGCITCPGLAFEAIARPTISKIPYVISWNSMNRFRFDPSRPCI